MLPTTQPITGIVTDGPDSGGVAHACPVCRSDATARFAASALEDYWICGRCEARFLDSARWLDRDAERAHYGWHQNDPSDAGYRHFLGRLVDRLLPRLTPGSSGLDYGCGPGPALAAMLREAGHEVALYDPFFAAGTDVLDRSYDFVTCTETAEHFHDPAAEFARLARLVRPGGWLGIMTCFQTDDARFAGWHYRKDPTHVVFYREATLRHIASCHGFSCDIPCKDVALLQKG